MAKRKTPRAVLDLSALVQRKPSAAPLVEPAEAVAIALSMVPIKSTGHICSPDSPSVRLVLHAIRLAGWKIEPQ